MTTTRDRQRRGLGTSTIGARTQSGVRRSVAAVILALLGVSGIARGDEILEVASDSLITYLPSGATAVQDIRPLANQRGVNLDGSLRAGSTFGLALHGNPLGAPWSGMQRLNGVRLDLGTYDASAVDLSLPAEVPWVIGRSYNARQVTSGGSARHSAGYQGQDWFQSSQPEIVYYDGATDADDVVYLVYGADRYIELHRVGGSSTEFKAVNGAAGVMRFAAGATGEPDTFTYYDQHGTRAVFFGFDGDASPAEGQLWKVIATDDEVAYIGDATTGSTAIAGGYDGSGRVLVAYDSSDRRFSYTYASVDGSTRLTQVEAETRTGGTWASPTGVATVGLVDYVYYASGDTTHGDSGYLKQVVRTVPMSSGPAQELKTYYRYDASGQDLLVMILEPEGVRQFDWAGDSTFDNDHFTSSVSGSYASAILTYDGSRRVSTMAVQGSCGCGGGASGLYEFTYDTVSWYSPSSGYDNEAASLAVVAHPEGHWHVQYFDETGQPLTRVVSTAEPLTSGSPLVWITHVERFATGGSNPGGAVSVILPPTGSGAWDDSTGNYATEDSSLDQAQAFALNSAAGVAGLPQTTSYVSGPLAATTYASRTTSSVPAILTIGDVDLVAVDVTATTGLDGETTVRDVEAWWGGAAALRPKRIVHEHPDVTTGNNGSGSVTTRTEYRRADGSAAFTVDPDGTWSYTQKSGGLVVKRIQDAKTNGSFASGDDPNGTWGITETGDGLHLVTEYTYDAQGRTLTVTAPDGSVSQMHTIRLADGQSATLSIPLVDGGDYYGPVGYTITNQAGKVTASGMLAFSGGSTSTAPSAWLDTGESVPTDAVLHGTLARLTVNHYDDSGSRVQSTDVYHEIPGSGVGTSGTNFDRTEYEHDAAGRVSAFRDPTGTITRTVHDAIGRYSATWIGTDDSGFDPSTGGGDMVKVSAVEYDGSSSLVQGKNSLVTKRFAFVEGSTTGQRVTESVHDARNRVVVTINPQAPHSVVKYDSSNRVIATGLYSSSSGLTASTDPTSATTNRVALTETAYDEMGRVWKTTRHKINFSSGASEDTLVTEMWYDADGRVAKTAGSQLTKTIYDRVGRPTNRFVLAKDNDASYADAVGGVAGDTVLAEDQTYYDPYGKPLMRVSIARHHDDTATTGPLDTDADLSLVDVSEVEGRASITAYWYDEMHRVADVVELGTFSGSDYDRDSYATPHARSDTALRTTTTFNDDGTVLQVQDPLSRYTRYTYDDMGRRLRTIANYVDGTAGGGTNGDEDQITEVVYASGLQTKFIAHVPGGPNQETLYTYGVTDGDSPGPSGITSNRVLRQVAYPDSTGGSDVVRFASNAQGQRIWQRDQAGNEIATDYDTGGRMTAQRVTTLASGFDGSVRAVRSAYDALGRVTTVTQYDDPTSTSSGDVTDQVQYAYDHWGNPTTFEQDFNSEISTNGDQWLVTSAWEKATGGVRTLRRTQEVIQRWKNSGGWALVDARDVRFHYGSGGSIDDSASRVQTVREQVGMSPVDLATYRYLGSHRIVGITYPEPSEDLVSNLHGTSSGSYPSLDTFGRIIASTWFKDHSAGDLEFYDIDIAYDRLSQVIRVEDNVYTGRDVEVTLDALSRTIKAEEGTWSGSAITSRTRQQVWELDLIGNWEADRVDLNGDNDFADAGEHDLSNTFNAVNEQTARGGATPVYDEVGNLTDNDEDQKYVYDAWGRLVEVRNQSSALISRHRYNGLGYRIAWQYDLDADGTVETSNSNHDPWLYFVYDSSWRIVASVFAVDDGAGRESGEHLAKADDDPRELFVFHTGGRDGRGSSSRLDDVILRDRDANTTWGNAGDGTAEERTYYAQNWRGDLVALLDSSGGRRETIAYSAFGVPFGRPGADVSGDGLVSAPDFNLILVAFGESYGDPNYSVVADINLDGSVNALDANLYSAQSGYTLGRGTLSRSPSLAGGVGNRVGYAGYAWEPSASRYHVRNRVLDPVRGRWNRRDALGYIDGPTMYAYVSNRAMSAVDPSGLFQRNLPQVQPVCPEIVEAGGDGEFALGECPVGAGGAGPGGGAPGSNGMSDSACQSAVEAAKRNNAKVKSLLKALQDAGCPEPDITCKTCSASEGGGGFYDPTTKTISICSNRVSNGTFIIEAVAHELVHAVDDCNGYHFNDCLDRACSEVRAYNVSGSCRTGGAFHQPGETYSECVRRMAIKSTGADPSCNAAEAVDFVFWNCFDDTSPL